MWDEFGLRGNPYELKAVEKEGLIPVSTFVGRTELRTKLKDTIVSRDHSLSLIVGDKGEGKTSLANIVRYDLFNDYFTLYTEIDSQSYWRSTDFITQILSLLFEQEEIIKFYDDVPKQFVRTAKEIRKLLSPLFIDSSSSFGVQATVPTGAGIGGSYGVAKNVRITSSNLNSIKVQFRKALNIIISNKYKGLILQFNNLDNLELDQKNLSQILADLRDFLVNDKCHFVFLGNKLMEGSFRDNPKVSDCVSTDAHLDPLKDSQVLEILGKRYDIFKIENRRVVAPVNDLAVKEIYKLYDGNVRHIFYSLDKAVVNSERILSEDAHQLGPEEVNRILNQLALERIKERIEPRAIKVLQYMIDKKQEVTNIEITKHFKLKTQNTSKYLKKLKDNNLITSIDYGGREVYYKIVEESKWLLLKTTSGTQKNILDSIM
jgi:DNA-binding transcriptional ArsR family regulator